MLVKFSMVSGQGFDMFENKALEFIKAMDLSGAIPSAINPEDIPAALNNLENTLNSIEKDSNTNSDTNEDYDDNTVNARTRAFPLIKLLKKAIEEDKSIMWDYV